MFSLSIIFVLGGVSASAVSWDSPVSVSETQLGSVAGTHIKAVSGHLVNNYTLSNASVYREGYPLYRYYIAFRKDKAARISYEEEKLMDERRNLCLEDAPEKKTLRVCLEFAKRRFRRFSEDFRPLSEDFRRYFKICPKARRTFSNILQRLPKITEDVIIHQRI